MDFKLFYNLSFNPFEKGTDDICIDTIDYREIQGRLNYLKETKGIGLFTGNSGVGKTYTIKKFCESLNPGLYKVIYMPMSTLTNNEFYKLLSVELGLELKYKKIDNYRQIQDCITRMVKEKRITPVIILDEAQYLRTDILNDLKIIFNFDFDSKNYAIIVLLGLPNLVNILNKSIHDALKQRITIQYQIIGLDENEIPLYIDNKLKKANCLNKIFDDSAINALSNICQGSLRKLNNILTKALIIGANQNKQLIDNEIIMVASNEII